MKEVLIAVSFIGVLFILLGWLLHYAYHYIRPKTDSLVDQVEAILPQTQCAQCSYPGCRPYAEAIVHEDEQINRCPPGGEAGIKALADLLNREFIPFGEETLIEEEPLLAVIREAECIGCTKCIQACPVDAIIGAPKVMHTVINDYCTGCKLCIPPCPMDCIDMINQPKSLL